MKELNATQKEGLNIAILRVAEQNHTRFGLTPEAFQVHVQRYAFEVDRDAIEERLEYLEGKELLGQALKQISKENRAWRISPKGRAFLDERNL